MTSIYFHAKILAQSSTRWCYGIFEELSRRERQIMEIIYRKGSATGAQIQAGLDGNVNYSTVRALLRILEEKGHLDHETSGNKYVYHPTVPRQNAIKSAVNNLLDTFFNNSVEQAVATLLEMKTAKLNKEELDRLAKMIEAARKEKQ